MANIKSGYKTRLVREALLECPLAIPSLLKDKSFDPSITRGILYNMIPRRTSIEIESFGSIFNTYTIPVHNSCYSYYANRASNKIDNHYKKLTKQLNVMSFERDGIAYERQYGFVEHKISIKDYSQAPGLYKALELMKQHCELNPKSGCHIHIDVSHIYEVLSKKSASTYWWNIAIPVQDFFTYYLTQHPMSDIFGPYTGNYMRDIVGFGKTHQVNLRFDIKTIEFRTAPMSFDYKTIIKWFIECNKIINKLEKYVNELPMSKSTDNEARPQIKNTYRFINTVC